jgi:hypothetical protein
MSKMKFSELWKQSRIVEGVCVPISHGLGDYDISIGGGRSDADNFSSADFSNESRRCKSQADFAARDAARVYAKTLPKRRLESAMNSMLAHRKNAAHDL